MSDPTLQVKMVGRSVRQGLRCLLGMMVCLSGMLIGCASVSNPVADGIPARFLPPEAFGESKDLYKQIPEGYLRQPPPDPYRLASGDVLGVWVEGILGEKNNPPTVLRGSDAGGRPPAIGYPIPVREDGTIQLPLIEPLKVSGLSIEEAQAAVVKAYTVTKEILKPGQERVIVTLFQPRTYHVLVLREDAGSVSFGSTGGSSGLTGGSYFTETRKSTGTPLDLSAYENDLLTALTKTGGMPGFEAEEEVIIQRFSQEKKPSKESSEPLRLTEQTPSIEGGLQSKTSSSASRPQETIRVPLRYQIGNKPTINPSDIILQNGDIVSVNLRRGDVFYTGGLLPPRVFPLPRNRDLDVIEALILIGAPIINGGVGTNNLTGNIGSGGGLSNISPSLVTILRRTSSGGQIPIRVNLNLAFRDPRERVRILHGDLIILQSTMFESVMQYTLGILHFDFLGTIVRQKDLIGTSNLSVP